MSPILGHINATLEGLSIIRTHGVEETLKNEYDEHLDLNMTAFHLKEITSRFMNFYCHAVGLAYSTSVIAILLCSKGKNWISMNKSKFQKWSVFIPLQNC